MKVTTTTLEMLEAPAAPPRDLPDGFRAELATGIAPEYARFLYALIGGPWTWTDRLGWTREQWAQEIDVPGSELWVLYGDGVPRGYVHLQPQAADGGTHVEFRYFGIVEQVIGRGIGRAFLEHAIAAAWSLPSRAGMAPATRVWLHTSTLDGPAAVSNYKGRGFVVCAVTDAEDATKDAGPVGSWVSSGGPAS